jgi:hypothetical protein
MRSRLLALGICAAIPASVLMAGQAAQAASGPCRVLPVSTLPLAKLEASYRKLTQLPAGTPLTAFTPHRYGVCDTTHYAFQPMSVATGVHLSYREQVAQQDHSPIWRQSAGGAWVDEGIDDLCALAPHALIDDWHVAGARCS